jgi:hypothetical protein
MPSLLVLASANLSVSGSPRTRDLFDFALTAIVPTLKVSAAGAVVLDPLVDRACPPHCRWDHRYSVCDSSTGILAGDPGWCFNFPAASSERNIECTCRGGAIRPLPASPRSRLVVGGKMDSCKRRSAPVS